MGYELTPCRVIQITPSHKLATISRSNQVTANMELSHDTLRKTSNLNQRKIISPKAI